MELKHNSEHVAVETVDRCVCTQLVIAQWPDQLCMYQKKTEHASCDVCSFISTDLALFGAPLALSSACKRARAAAQSGIPTVCCRRHHACTTKQRQACHFAYLSHSKTAQSQHLRHIMADSTTKPSVVPCPQLPDACQATALQRTMTECGDMNMRRYCCDSWLGLQTHSHGLDCAQVWLCG